jgi:hypothetical protein
MIGMDFEADILDDAYMEFLFHLHAANKNISSLTYEEG